MTRGQRLAPLTPIERRAHEAAEAILDGSGFRYQTEQIAGLALVLMTFAENEIRLRGLTSPVAVDAVAGKDDVL
jgi:hypothetical protein